MGARGQCPACGYAYDTHTCVSDAGAKGPAPGDYSMCMKCGVALEFGAEGQLVEIPDQALPPDALGMIVLARRYLRRRRIEMN